jgi:hypothetical protein
MVVLPVRLILGESENVDNGNGCCTSSIIPEVVDGVVETTSHQGSPS